jgi:hypothetical protein
MIHFDHIEVHVKSPKQYLFFLKKLFRGGRFKKITKNETYMFLTNDLLRIEVKQSKILDFDFNNNGFHGFCLPCLRMKNAPKHLEKLNNITIVKKIINPDGECIFFKDYEGIDWHIKNYQSLDIFTNI